MITIKSYLPVFNGFYGTLFESDDAMEVENWQENTKNYNICYDDLDFDYDDYTTRVAESCVSEIWNELNHFTDNGEIDIEFESVVKPRSYNFGNDSINVIYTLNKAFLSDLRDFLLENVDEVKNYIKERYTSRSGFSSFYSNDVADWIDDIDNLMAGLDVEGIEHKFGSLLETYFFIEGYTDEDLADAVSSEMYINATIKN